MTSHTLGSYKLGPPIGRGGMGKVFRAIHGRTGVEVALKVITDSHNQHLLDLFQREVRAQARLVHPGVVYLFDYGTVSPAYAAASGGELVAHSPFVAMEFADKGSLRDHLPLTNWITVRQLLVQVLQALAFAHARSLIHRDLKPENLLLFSDGPGGEAIVKIADFGLAHAVGEEYSRNKESLAGFSGTPLYMAPEQFRGRWRTYGPWTDLYALGCIAYELVCGRPPFTGNSAVSLGLAHCDGPRPPLTPRIAVPAELEEWIHRALRVDVKHRFRRAADALYALPMGRADRSPVGSGSDLRLVTREPSLTQAMPISGDSEVTRVWQRTKLAPPPDLSSTASADGPSKLPTRLAPPLPDDWRPLDDQDLPMPLVDTGLGLFDLREVPFVSRHKERDLIWQNLHRVVNDGDFRIVLLLGPEGCGKSALAQWTTTRAHEVGASIPLKLIHSPGPDTIAEGIPGLVQRAFRTWGLSRGELHDYMATQLSSRDARAMTELVHPVGHDQEADGPRFHIAGSAHKLSLLARLFAFILSDRPAVVWADDLQWGQEARDLMIHLADHPHFAPTALVMACIRSEHLADDDELRHHVETLRKHPSCEVLELEPLPYPDQLALIKRLLPVTSELAEEVALRTAGNLTFTQQLLGEWIAADRFALGPEGFQLPAGVNLGIPDDLHHLWQTRLNRLLSDLTPAQATDDHLALQAAAVLGRQFSESIWRQVCRAQQLTPSQDLLQRLTARRFLVQDQQTYSFPYPQLVHSLLRAADEQSRLPEHNLHCATILSQQTGPHSGPTASRIADHWIQAGRLDEAYDFLGEAHTICLHSGNAYEEKQLLERQFDLLNRLGVGPLDRRLVQLQIYRARHQRRVGNLSMARALVDPLLESLPHLSPNLGSSVCELQGDLLIDEGQLAEVHPWLIESHKLAERSGDLGRLAMVESSLGWFYFCTGDLDQSQEHTEKAFDLFVDLGVLYRRYRQLSLLGWLYLTQGKQDEAEAAFTEVIDWSRELGYLDMEANTLNALGEIARYGDDLDRALICFERAQTLARELDSQFLYLGAKVNHLQVELLRREFDDAQDLLAEATRATQNSGDQSFRLTLEYCELCLAAGQGRFDDVQKWWKIIGEAPPETGLLIKDLPHLLEYTARLLQRADRPDLARPIGQRAVLLWGKLGDTAAAERAVQDLGLPSTNLPSTNNDDNS